MNTNLTIGLALSGGGHKGLAHAGVLQWLDEQDIQLDLLAGTSAGAIVASLYASGMPPQEILRFFQSVKLFRWSNWGFSKAGLLDAEKFIGYLDQAFGEQRLGELQREVYITATDINTGRLKIFDRHTKVKEAVAASSAFPGVFSPVNIDGRLYSDGGILSNFPVSAIQGRCDFIIGVNLDPNVNMERAPRPITSIKDVAFRAINIMMSQNTATQNELCDWCIAPPNIGHYNIFEMSKERMADIYNLGYATAKSQWKAVRHKFQI